MEKPGSETADYVKGNDAMAPGDKARGRVTTALEFRAGDGPMLCVKPDYELELERAPQSVVMSWQEDGQPMNAAIPVVEFDQWVQSGQIVIDR